MTTAEVIESALREQEVEFERFRRITAVRPFTMPVTQTHTDPDDYRVLMDFITKANEDDRKQLEVVQAVLRVGRRPHCRFRSLTLPDLGAQPRYFGCINFLSSSRFS